MLLKSFVTILAIVGALAFPVGAQAQQQRGEGHAAGGGGHPAAAAARMHAPAGGFARGGHFTGPGGTWNAHPVWHGSGEFQQWRGGHWWTGTYGGRTGAWWIVGPDWYWYPVVVPGIPDPYVPPGMAPGYWYWCPPYQQYYPYVGACPVPWQQMPAQ